MKGKLPDYSQEPCFQCGKPAFAYMRGKGGGAYLCELHFWALYTPLFTLVAIKSKRY